jgi:hypothetical protein
VFKYRFTANLNYAFSFMRLLKSNRRLLKFFDTSIIYAFLKAWEISSWFMEIVLVSCVSTLYICIGWKCSSLFVMKFINEVIYSHGSVKISSPLNSSPQELWDLALIMKSNSFLLKCKYLFAVRCITPEGYSKLHWRLKVSKINWFESISVAVIQQRSNMLHLTLETTDRLGFSSINDYQI